jgi:hypothetical protein
MKNTPHAVASHGDRRSFPASSLDWPSPMPWKGFAQWNP